jgi:demethylmenaquinone methyltransferase/2-methoxy-6-polyprenyl-1,4-benzoquinol methylase
MTKKNNHQNPEAQWFGFEKTNPTQKTEKVLNVFRSVADSYDVMNDAMSLGIHRLWKKRFVSLANPKKGEKILDVAGGTGDISFLMHEKSHGQADITISDINPDMLRVGQDRAVDRGYLNVFSWQEANAETLPFDDNTFDLYTISFGLRNVTHIDHALKEVVRVLKPGGRFYCLEFSKVPDGFLSRAYDIYSFHVLPKLGEMIANDRDSYQYLAESIRKFPSQMELKRRLEEVGLQNCGYKNLSAGIASIHWGWKI